MDSISTEVEEVEVERVRCMLCATQVWLRSDRLEKHIARVHPLSAPSKKGFTQYHARLESTPLARKVLPPTPGQSAAEKEPIIGNVILLTRQGRRSVQGRCAECGQEGVMLWNYAESTRGPLDICGSCKPLVFERSFGSTGVDNPEPATQA